MLCKEVARQWMGRYHSTNAKVRDEGSRFEGQRKHTMITWGRQEENNVGENGSSSESGSGSESSRLSVGHQ